jgi:cytochrome c peroxidase
MSAIGCGASSPPACDIPQVPAQSCATAHAMALPTALPPARGNKYGDDLNAATLGFYIFFDANVGAGVGCVTCHAPELTFTDRIPVAMGKGTGTRNTPTTFNAARLSVFFWDGRADSLWSQPLFAIENPLEMASSRLALARYVAQNYGSSYEAVFGALPDMTSWPAAGAPGDPAYDGLTPDVQQQVDRFAANVGKALEAYLRQNASGQSPFDRFLAGDATQLTDVAQQGFRVFLEGGCPSCHSGPMLTDESFHDVGFPGLPDAGEDPGRASGLAILQKNEFNLDGPFADPGPGVPGQIPTGTGQFGAFRTPSLRNVARTFPYAHDGQLTTLQDVLALHAPQLDANAQGTLIAFFEALNGDNPPPPWNDWPVPQ